MTSITMFLPIEILSADALRTVHATASGCRDIDLQDGCNPLVLVTRSAAFVSMEGRSTAWSTNCQMRQLGHLVIRVPHFY